MGHVTLAVPSVFFLGVIVRNLFLTRLPLFMCAYAYTSCHFFLQLEGQLHGLQQAAGQAAEYVKRLEQTNYALSVRVQAMGNSGASDFMGSQRPPDVF